MLRVGEAVDLPGHLILAGQARTEQQRVVGAQRQRHPGLEQGPDRHVLRLRCHPQAHVRGRAHLQGHPPVRDLLHQAGILDRPDPMPDPVGPQRFQALPYARRAHQFATVRIGEQPGPVGDPERALEVVRPAAPLVVGQPEPDHPAPRVAAREPGQRLGVQRMARPVRCDDHTDADPGGRGGLPDRVQDQFHGRSQPAEPVRVAGRVHLDLQPARALGRLVLGGLAHQPPQVVLGPQHRTRDVVQPLEPEPAALVGRAQLRRPVLDQCGRQVHPVLVGQLRQGRMPHRTGEVQMQVGFRQSRNQAGLHHPILP